MKSAGTPLTSQLLLPGGTASWTSRNLLTDATSPAEPFAFRNTQFAQQIAQRKVHKRTMVCLSVSPESLCSSKRISSSHKEEFFFVKIQFRFIELLRLNDTQRKKHTRK